MKIAREKMVFRNDEESSVWVQFAAGAASGVGGESEEPAEDAIEIADLADALLVQFRKRMNK
jgi:hypothetical protein